MPNLKKIFSKIYDKYVAKIYRFIFLKVNSKEIAQDLTSETFLKAWKAFSFQRSEFRVQNPQAFLYKIAKNLVTDYYREKAKIQLISAESSPIIDPRINLEEKAIQNSDLELVKKAILKLKDEYQDAIIWYYLEGYSVSEIAKILDKSEPATRMLISRAIKNLKKEYEKLINGQRTMSSEQ
jgi:RNA polymerase sigma-70 factor (ECF subfamily)